jgi:hypothetical protein
MCVRSEGACAWVKPGDVVYTKHGSFSAGDNREKKRCVEKCKEPPSC